MSSSIVVDDRREIIHAFVATAEHLAILARAAGISLVAASPAGPVWFERLAYDEQRKVLHNLTRYVEVCAGVVAAGQSLADDQALLWRMFLRLGVRPLSDFMARVGSGDVIEIYDAGYVQVFRNLRFIACCSYSVDELVSRPFWELFHRQESVTKLIVDAASAALAGTVTATQLVMTGPHTIDEVDSPMLYHSVVDNKLLAPLFGAGTGQVEAVVTTIRSISCVSQRIGATHSGRLGKSIDVERPRQL